MATKAQVQAAEREAAREARETSHRANNYQLKAFQTAEIVAERPWNCYGCAWERLPDNEGFRLKFKHALCYPAHVRDATQE